MNLVSNAIKFSPVNSNIHISAGIEQDFHQIVCEGRRDSNFERGPGTFNGTLFPWANAMNIQGTGLGLHLISKYAELMNGKIDCRSGWKRERSSSLLFLAGKLRRTSGNCLKLLIIRYLITFNLRQGAVVIINNK